MSNSTPTPNPNVHAGAPAGSNNTPRIVISKPDLPPPPYSEYASGHGPGSSSASGSSSSGSGSSSTRHAPPPTQAPHPHQFHATSGGAAGYTNTCGAPGPHGPSANIQGGYYQQSPSQYPQNQYPHPQYPQPYPQTQVPVPVPYPQPQYPHPHPHPHPPHFGPTPLDDRQVLLPYAFYGERAAVDARARWRFCSALFWAIGIYFGVAFLVGVEAFGDGWWMFNLNRASI